MTVRRVVQGTLPTGFARLYLERHAAQSAAGAATHAPLSLLSIGQLLFSALTSTAFSRAYLDQSPGAGEFKYRFLLLGGLVFNWFLTLAFWRATRPVLAVPGA